TPAATAEDRAELETRYQIQDAAAVVSEPMPLIGWAVEDTFAAGRPPLERVGVRFVEDVTGYEKLKLRLLNAGHSALAYPGILCGHRYIHEALGNPAIAGLLEAFWRESQGTLSAVSGVSPQDYCRNLWERFGNQALRDTTERVSSDGSGKIPSFVVPIARECIAAGRPPRMCGLIVAAWIRHLGGVDDQGQAFRVIDPQADQLRPLALGDVSGLRALLARADIFADLAGNETFATAVETALRLLRERGVAQTIQAALGSAR
ncbi:MAG: hypothetical protein K2V38_18320, partial [Gemmataceae bacterium]|nr:hypothetical protein [Gemmataceae bacterium]